MVGAVLGAAPVQAADPGASWAWATFRSTGADTLLARARVRARGTPAAPASIA
jgi:hypothetical protein